MNNRGTQIQLARTARCRSRRGFILIFVLGLTVVVTALGISFLESNSTAMPEAVNRAAAARARYLAESGIALGTHFLMYPPTTVTSGDYWTGGTGIAVDLTDDYTNVAIIQDAVDPKLFTITATGVAKDPDGTIRGKKRAAAQVIVPDDGKWHIPYALLGVDMAVPATVRVQGDVHANGNLVGLGECQDDVSASGTASWPGSGPPASVTSAAALVPRPQADPALYAAYNIRGASYTAYVYNKASMFWLDANALNAIDMSATNPGRIIMAPVGDFWLRQGTRLTGTLVVDGNLTLSDGVLLTAVPDYPVLVVTGDILYKQSNMFARLNGSVICGGAIDDSNKSGILLRVDGACIVGRGFNRPIVKGKKPKGGKKANKNKAPKGTVLQTDGFFDLKWQQQGSIFWDFRKSSERLPITILSWKED